MKPARRLRILLACSSLLLLTAGCRAETAPTAPTATAPTFSLTDSDLTIDSPSGEGRGSLLLKADGLDAAGFGEPLGPISDLQSPLPRC
jgi:hypothetical protein